ncbi:hypothetical protein VNO78_16169 [Psophocarpus tetragonolobus]|uniref:Uncharacterized protein n=1 Tax=Psophocarpus tetragonolobus TaxID=3891 RepID=A0AAN9SHU6_PSOTE
MHGGVKVFKSEVQSEGRQVSLRHVSLRRVRTEGQVSAGRFSACQARVEKIRPLETGLRTVAQIQPLDMACGSRWAATRT